MKKLLPILIPFLFVQKAMCQPVVFCPPGAEWHYLFDNFWHPDTNEEVKYIRDSIIGQDTFKVLKHKRKKFYLNDNIAPGSNGLTLIKQKGDTVFFKNYLTQGSWQILYNFAAQPGDTWQTTVIVYNGAQPSVTYNYTVNAVGSVNINSFSLRTMSVSCAFTMTQWPNPNPTPALFNAQFTERFGGSKFMFNFVNYKWSSDGDMLKSFLCYEDDQFGLKQFTDTYCEFNADVSIDEVSETGKNVFFPNPATDKISMEIHNASGNLSLCLSDISGRELKQTELQSGRQKHTIDLSGLAEGVYLISVMRDKELLYSGKVIKQE